MSTDSGSCVFSRGAVSFEEEVRRELSRVRRAFADVVDAVTDRDHGEPKAIDLHRTLGIPSTLAWQVYRVATAPDPFCEVESIPGRAALSRVIRAGRRKGLPEARLTELLDSADALEAFVQSHASNRRTFNSMVSSLSSGPKDSIALNCRRTAFLANSQIWGVQAKTVLWTAMYHRGTEPDTIGHALITGGVDFVRLHPDARPVKIRAGLRSAAAATDNPVGHSFGPVLLEEFSTRPLPIVERTRGSDGLDHIQLLPHTMGNTGATTYFVSEGDLAVAPDELNARYIGTHFGCYGPSKSMLVDLLIDRELYGEIAPDAAVFDGREPRHSFDELLTRRRLPMRVEAVHQGSGLDAMHAPDLRTYPRVVEDVCSKLGWDPASFDVYRCKIDFPIMSSVTAIWSPLNSEE